MRKTAPVKSTTRSKKKTSKAFSGSITPKYAHELQLNWRRCIPSVLGDLFTYESPAMIRRYNTYALDDSSIEEIVLKLNKKKGNITHLSFALGLSKEFKIPRFQPLLRVTLNKAVGGSKEHFFLLKPIQILNPISNGRLAQAAQFNSKAPDGQLSLKVAEIFMLNWQSLTEGELISAFEGVTPNGVIVDGVGEDAIVTFGRQSIERVEKYIFDKIESAQIVEDLTSGFKTGIVKFFIRMGAGLKVADFHPFSFRPIINVVSELETRNRLEDDDDGSNFYDTSRPCPPFCPEPDDSK